MSPAASGEAGDPTTEVERALDEVRPYLGFHGGAVEVVAVEPPVVRVRLSGACAGDSRSAITLRDLVQSALVTRVAGVERVDIVPDGPAVTIPIGSVGLRRRSTEGPAGQGEVNPDQ
jgi:Fe-S cluster biogenesis protein NfuA